MFRSTDNGDSWLSVNSGLPSGTIWALGTNQSGYVFAAMAVSDYLYRSTDNGFQWASINAGSFLIVSPISIHISPASHIYVGDGFRLGGAIISRSVDKGDNFVQLKMLAPLRTIIFTPSTSI